MKRCSKYVRARQLLKNKPRKVLKLEERVQAIHLYEREPVYQRVATALNCSWEQIKSVIANRRSILQYYVDCQSISSDDAHDKRLVRRKKINFLGNVMFEYIKRAHYHSRVVLNDLAISERALEFRDILQIAQFYPNRAWITDFKKTYNIDFDHMEGILIIQPPETTLVCADIIRHCKKELDKALVLASRQEDKVRCAAGDGVDVDDCVPYADDEEGPTIDFGYYEADAHATSPAADKSSTYDVTHVAKADSQKETMIAFYETKPTKTNTATAPTTPRYSHNEIVDYVQALTLLHPLEVFAISEEDFRAMNLLSQLAQHYEAHTAQ